ncbi:MAG: membrane dipeptidase [Bacilli bacterium]|nr:membrane dipeptidase [Bacilli bacterium]
MVDAHYDLLSICYVCYLKNDYTKIEKIAKEIKSNKEEIKCIFANLYFMSEDEMKNELHPSYYIQNVSVLDMFKIAKEILERYLPEIDFLYSIEGCDYIEIDDLELLYNEGLRSIIPVWNTENKYGSGNRTNKGLTKEGINLINQAIDLGIGIDLSHANLNTFYGIIEVIKEKQKLNKEVICYASHSNARILCDRERNLTDVQLKLIKEVSGLVGIFSNRNFITHNYNLNKEEQQLEYLKHIIYISNIIGIDNVMLSTDDMRFCGDIDPEYYELPIYDYSNIVHDTKQTLLKYFSLEDTNKILYGNAYSKIIDKLNIKSNRKCKKV